MKKRALISVSDKTGIVTFAKDLVKHNYEIISTGGTKQALDDAGIPTLSIEEVTGFPEILDGRVKTLHPMIHGGLLAKMTNPAHVDTLKKFEIQPISFVVVNLYPFKETIQKPGITEDEAIEQIDIGGPSMLRSSAKNFASVTVVVDKDDYPKLAEELDTYGETQLTTRKKLALKVFQHTAAYDARIADYLAEHTEKNPFPDELLLQYEKKQVLRYGENPHQQAAFYVQNPAPAGTIASTKQLHGKELSYNNIRDTDAAMTILAEYSRPTIVAVKHMNPCGIGTGTTIEEAFDAAYAADPVSIFGGIIASNQKITLPVAERMAKMFLEVIVAPEYDEDARQVLEKKKNIRLLLATKPTSEPNDAWTSVSVGGGLLIQGQDNLVEDVKTWQVVTKRKPTVEELQALEFAWKAVKHVKSNAIVLANATQTVGIGAGQMNRVGSVEIALNQAEKNEALTGAVLASDAFFPMSDSVELAAKHGIKAIIQPGGSIKDQESIEMADQYDIAMIFTNVRHFRH